MEYRKLIVLQGCPCSGKSTWAKKFIEDLGEEAENWFVLNRDTIRFNIGKGTYDHNHENLVNKIEKEYLELATFLRKNIIVDGTNLNPKTIKRWERFAEQNFYEIEWKKFYVPFKEAMERSKKRKEMGGHYISKKTMTFFYEHYCKEKIEEERTDKRVIREYVEGLPDAVICDLDLTLALHQGRNPYDWSRIHEDKIDPRLQLILNMYMENGVTVLFVTGRSDSAREQTSKWLSDNKLGTDWELFTKPNNSFEHGDEYKRRVYRENIENKYNVLCVFEDSNKCVKMWREEGLLTCQVENNDY